MSQSLLTQLETILDEAAGAVFWPTIAVWDAVNEVLLDVWPRTAHLTTSTTVVVTPSDEFISLPTSVVMIPQYWIGTDGRLFATTAAKLEQWSANWRTANASYPQHFMAFDADTVRPYPVADATYTYTLVGTPWPPELSDANPTFTADPTLVTAVAHLAAAKLFEHTFPMLADVQAVEGEEVLQRYISNVKNQLSHRQKKLRPGNRFNVAQHGTIGPSRRLPQFF